MIKIEITDLTDFKDMMIGALRYALPRHTYIVAETLDFIRDNAFYIIDRRTKRVMLEDVERYFRDYANTAYAMEMDRRAITAFKEWLENYEVEE